MTDEVTERVRRLVAERRKMRGIGEEIVGVHFGTDREAWLTNDDLLALCTRIAELEGALAKIDKIMRELRAIKSRPIANSGFSTGPALHFAQARNLALDARREIRATLNGEKKDG